jgi:hypothetical protein
MDPGRSSPLKHARGFAWITLACDRRSALRGSAISPTARLLCGHSSHQSPPLTARRIFAAQMTGAGEQPGRERPHPETPYPDARVGLGVAHVPAAGAESGAEIRHEFPQECMFDSPMKVGPPTRLDPQLISSDIVDDVAALAPGRRHGV